jgi:hypothetical protein
MSDGGAGWFSIHVWSADFFVGNDAFFGGFDVIAG